MTDVERYLRGAVDLPGVNVATAPRCGDADRQRASDRISEAYARGFLAEDEAQARLDGVALATLGAHLSALTADIPLITRWKGATLPERRETRAQEWVKWWQLRQPWTGLASMGAGMTGGIVPTVIATVLHAGGWIAVCAATTIPACGLLAIGGLSSIVAWASAF